MGVHHFNVSRKTS